MFMTKLILTSGIAKRAPPKPTKMTKNLFPKPEKIKMFSNRSFDILEVAKRRRRLEFRQRVAPDFPNASRRPNDERNQLLPRISTKTFAIAGLVACTDRGKFQHIANALDQRAWEFGPES